jgi:hypothetical protein
MKVLIGTPAYGGQVTESYFQSILQFKNVAWATGIDVSVMTISNESLITRARNNIIAEFMKNDYTDLVFIDADIKFDPIHLERLLQAPYELCETPYAMKGLNWDEIAKANGTVKDAKEAGLYLVINTLRDQKDVKMENGFLTVLDAGTGFMRIRKSVIEKMIEAYPETAYESDDIEAPGSRYALFDTIIDNGRYLSEDYAFCRRWQAIGGQVWADIQTHTLGHQGSYTYGR